MREAGRARNQASRSRPRHQQAAVQSEPKFAIDDVTAVGGSGTKGPLSRSLRSYTPTEGAGSMAPHSTEGTTKTPELVTDWVRRLGNVPLEREIATGGDLPRYAATLGVRSGHQHRH